MKIAPAIYRGWVHPLNIIKYYNLYLYCYRLPTSVHLKVCVWHSENTEVCNLMLTYLMKVNVDYYGFATLPCH
jgi:hypothetical protein